MHEITGEAPCEAPVHAVWEALARFDDIEVWLDGCTHCEIYTTERAGVGMGRRLEVSRMALLEVVTEWKPDEALSYEIIGFPEPISTASSRWTLEPRDSGTYVTVTTSVEMGRGFLGTAAYELLVKSRLRDTMQKAATGLVEHVELALKG
jgi:hypothetical protein